MDDVTSDKARAELTKITERITGRKYCTSCQSEKPPEGGVTRVTRHSTRWQCAACAGRARDRGVIR